MDLSALCYEYTNTPFSDVAAENKIIEQLYLYQKETLKNLLLANARLQELKETFSPEPKLDYYFVSYSNPITIYLETLTIIVDDDNVVNDMFVNKSYVSKIFKTYYQTLSSATAYINNTTVIVDDGNKIPLVSKEYFESNYLNINNSTIYNCVTEISSLSDCSNNQVLGTIILKNNFLFIDDVIDLSTKTIGSSNGITGVSTDTLVVKTISIKNTPVKSLSLISPTKLLNWALINELFVTKSNPYLLNNAVVVDELVNNSNILRVIDVKQKLKENKASLEWETEKLIKTDSQQTTIVDDVVDAVLNNKQLDKKEAITYAELNEALDKLIGKIVDIVGECQ